jgi:hypothetical protein
MPESLIKTIRKLEEQNVKKYLLKGKVLNLHGEYATRLQVIGETVVQQIDKALETSGIKKDKVAKEEIAKILKRKRIETVHTFPRNEKNELLAPLGGQRGYILGMMKVVAKNRYRDVLKSKSWEGYGLIRNLENGVFIKPDWVPLGKEISNPKDQPLCYTVQTAGSSRTITWNYYDYAKEAPFEVTVEVEIPIPEEILLNLFAGIQRLGLGPKRRGRLILEDVIRLTG